MTNLEISVAKVIRSKKENRKAKNSKDILLLCYD